MPDILVRDFDAEKLERLKERAKRNGRSLQSEVKMVLEESIGASPEEVKAMLEKWKKHFAGRQFSKSSVEMIREDRER